MSLAANNPLPTKTAVFTRDFVLLCLTYFVFTLGAFVVVPVLPLYGSQINATESEIGLAVGVMSVSSLIIRLFAGHAVDSRPKIIFIVAGSALCALSILSMALVDNIPLIVILRTANGVGAGLMLAGAYSLAADLSPSARRGEALGYFGTSANIGMALGPLVGVWTMQQAGFAAVFVLGAAATIAGLVASLAIRAASKSPLAAPTSFKLGWDGQVIGPSLMGILLFLTYGGLASFLPLFVVRESMGNPGLFFTAMAATVVAVRAFAGGLSDRRGRAAILVPGFILVAVSLAILMAAHSLQALVLAGVIYGAGYGSVQPTLLALATDHTSHGKRGVALAMIGSAFDLGVGFGGILFGPVVQFAGFNSFFVASMLCPLLGLALVLLRRPGKERGHRPQLIQSVDNSLLDE